MVVLKLLFFRGKDIVDIERVLAAQASPRHRNRPREIGEQQ